MNYDPAGALPHLDARCKPQVATTPLWWAACRPGGSEDTLQSLHQDRQLTYIYWLVGWLVLKAVTQEQPEKKWVENGWEWSPKIPALKCVD